MEAHREVMGEPVRFGNPLQLRERSRDVWGWAWLDALWRDVRFAARGLRRTPLFTLVATLSLALGLALTTSTVAIVNAYLIRSLPYPESDSSCTTIMYAPPGPWEPAGMTALDWTSVADVVEFPIAASGESFYVGDGGYTQALRGMRVTRGFVEGLGVGVAAGRRLAAQDFTAGSEPIALVGHALWRDRFASDPGAIGRLIRAETESRPGKAETFRIVGVLAPGFYFGRDRTGIDVLVPHPAPIRTYMVLLPARVPPAAGAPAHRSRAARGDVADSERLVRRAAGIGARSVARQSASGAALDHGRGQPRARDRLRQCRRADAAALDAASEGSGGQAGARLRMASHRADAPDRNRDPLHHRARSGHRDDGHCAGQSLAGHRNAARTAGAERGRDHDRPDRPGYRRRPSVCWPRLRCRWFR